MLKIKRCGLFFIIIIIFSILDFAFTEEPSSLDLEPIVISKSKIHLANTYTLEYETLASLPFSSLVEALSSLPLDLQSRSLKGGIQTDFSLRGSTFQGVLILIDGERINDPQTGHHNSDIPVTLEDIERIEVIPGVGSSLFGPDAIGGAINIITKKPKEKKRTLELGGGSHQTTSTLFSLSEKISNCGMRFSLENQESQGFYEDADFKKFTTHFYSLLDIPDGEFNLQLGYQEKEFGAYDFYTPAKGYLSKEWTKTYLLNTGFNLDKEGLIIKPNFLWRRHFDKFALDKKFIRSLSLNHHRTDVYTPNIYLQKEAGILGRLGLGLEYGEERINSTNLGKYNRNHKSVFIDESKELTSKVSAGASFRFDKYDAFDEVYTGALNLKYALTEAGALRFGISQSMRIPSFTELYYNDATTLGNANLSSEESRNYQLGYAYQKKDTSGGISFFFRQEEDFIDWIKRTSGQEKWQAENITASEVKGIESYLKLKIRQNLTLNTNYTYIDKRIDDQGYLYKYGQNYIRHLTNAIFNLNLPFGTQEIGFTYKKKPGRDGWFLLNSRFSCHFNKNFQVFLKITNLLNVEYQEIEGISQPGRWIEAGLRLEW